MTTILCVNSGSSSIKFAFYRVDQLLLEGEIKQIGGCGTTFWWQISDGDKKSRASASKNHEEALIEILDHHFSDADFDIIVHRIVHGGRHYTAPALIDEAMLTYLRTLIPYVPLHLPSEIRCIEILSERYSGVRQLACFDTAFHRAMPEVAKHYPLPGELWDQGIERYGFHGLSYEYILHAIQGVITGKLIVAHMGNGVSLAAVAHEKPMDTTMGFTPTGGVMMGARSGDLDPGLLVYLMKEKGYTLERISEMINHGAGLCAISETTGDMKTLLEKQNTDPKAAFAVEMFCYAIAKAIGALAAALNGLDHLIFTGGMGENAPAIRARICQFLTHLGMQIDDNNNLLSKSTISKTDSRCQIHVIPTNEAQMMAVHARNYLGKLAFSA